MSRARGPVACTITKPLGDANGRLTARSIWRATQGAARHLGQQRVEATVLLDVAARTARRSVPARASSASMRSRQSRASAQQHRADAALGRQPRGQALERAAQLDRVVDVALGEVLARHSRRSAAARAGLPPAAAPAPCGSACATTPSRSTSASSAMRAPGLSSPPTISSRRRSCALTVCDDARRCRLAGLGRGACCDRHRHQAGRCAAGSRATPAPAVVFGRDHPVDQLARPHRAGVDVEVVEGVARVLVDRLLLRLEDQFVLAEDAAPRPRAARASGAARRGSSCARRPRSRGRSCRSRA